MTEPHARSKLLVTLTMILIALLVANLFATGLIWYRVINIPTLAKPPRSLPCEAIPIRFVHDEPECTDKLLRAMNVTNVRVQSYGNGHAAAPR